ncbi:hypothetical protein [Streptomyces albofaciens]|uniref:hypothetical protein n=1 Tax=Streptomyces albofaciens TaxID=66866 RepID=UPI000A9DC977|nr:hypothetical protein [Streptomyces albofaciens]
MLKVLSLLTQGREAEIDAAGETLGVGMFLSQEGQGEVDSFDLTSPTFYFCYLATGHQITFYLVEPGQHSGVCL